MHNPLRYRGYVYDTDSGLYYLQSRYYNPTLGRFINADALASTGQGLLGNNMFAYCGNNSINYSDKSGNRFYHYAYDQPGAGSESKNDNDASGATVSVGLTASFCITGWTYFAQISIATDTDGDTELQITYGTALSTGDFGGSLMANIAFLNVPDVKNLHGMGYQLGALVEVRD